MEAFDFDDIASLENAENQSESEPETDEKYVNPEKIRASKSSSAKK